MIDQPDDKLDWRVSVTAGVGVTVAVGMVLLGMEPRLILVAFVVMTVAAAMWLVLDLGNAAEPLHWHDYGLNDAGPAQPDRRVRALRSRLERNARTRRTSSTVNSAGDDRSSPHDEIADTLVDVIDDHLRSEHGLDRSHRPEAAAAILGPDLTRFVTDPSARRSMTQRRSLARTVSMIEALESPPIRSSDLPERRNQS